MKRSLLLLLLLSFGVSSVGQKQGQARIDSILEILPLSKEDSNKVLMLTKLCYDHYPIDPDKGISYGMEAIGLADKLDLNQYLAEVYSSLGINYAVKAEYPNSIDYFLKGLEMSKQYQDNSRSAVILMNLGNVYLITSNYPKALSFYMDALRYQEQEENLVGMALTYGNIGLIYKNQDELPKALEFFNKALEINERLNRLNATANNLSSIGLVLLDQGKYRDAVPFFTRALDIQNDLGSKSSISKTLSYLATVHQRDGEYPKAIEYLEESIKLARELKEDVILGDDLGLMGRIYLELAQGATRVGTDNMEPGSKAKRLQLAIDYLDSAIVIQKEISNIRGLITSYNNLSEAKSIIGDFAGSLEAYKAYKASNDSIFNLEKDKKITETEMQFEFDKKEAAIRADQEIKDAVAKEELKKQKLIRNGLGGGLALVALFAAIIFFQRNRISKEKERSEDLLLNILPEETAQELKEKGHSDAQLIDQVSVLFTDFKGFAQLSELLSPKDLVEDLHACFSQFDRICSTYNIEKIKTIGDSYMAAGGLPTPNTTHASDVVKAALEMAEVVEVGKAKKVSKGLPFFEVRIGVHTGPVVAGIVGVKKFQYDIWGDTVNTASRMESSGAVGKVNISQSTYELLRDDPNLKFESRGKIAAKGKGEIEMYFVSKA